MNGRYEINERLHNSTQYTVLWNLVSAVFDHHGWTAVRVRSTN